MYPRPLSREISRETGAIRRSYSRESIQDDTYGERNRTGRGRAGRGGRGRGFGRGRGRGGGRSGRDEDGAQGHNPRPVRLGFKALQELDTKTPDEIILDLTSSRCFPATEFLLNQQSAMKDDWIVLTVSIIA